MDMMNRIEDKQLGELVDRYLSEDGVKAFDSIIEASHRRTSRVKALCWSAAGLAAAAIVAILIAPAALRPAPAPTQPLTGIQITEGIQRIMELDLGDVESINAKPMGEKALLTATLKDGSTYTYIMTCNEDEGSTSILACN